MESQTSLSPIMAQKEASVFIAIWVMASLRMLPRRPDSIRTHGIPTAVFGQGIGPIDDACLRARAEKVLKRVNLICLRETVTGLKLMNSLAVPRENVVVTGDDAIDSAYSRSEE